MGIRATVNKNQTRERVRISNLSAIRTLDGLEDVAITGLANNDILVYNSGTGLFENKPITVVYGGTF